jgi:hypothetical protein
MSKLCLVCGKEMNYIPAGTSKRTGQPYEAFWACPDKCKQPKEEKPKPVDTFSHNLGGDIRQEQIQKNVDAKRAGINASVALNNAVNLYHTDTGLVADSDQVLALAEKFLVWLDNKTK